MKLFVICFLIATIPSTNAETIQLTRQGTPLCPGKCVSEALATEQCRDMGSECSVQSCGLHGYKCSNAASAAHIVVPAKRERFYVRCRTKLIFSDDKCVPDPSGHYVFLGRSVYHPHCVWVHAAGGSHYCYEYEHFSYRKVDIVNNMIRRVTNKIIKCSPLREWLEWKSKIEDCLLTKIAGFCPSYRRFKYLAIVFVQNRLKVCCPLCQIEDSSLQSRA